MLLYEMDSNDRRTTIVTDKERIGYTIQHTSNVGFH